MGKSSKQIIAEEMDTLKSFDFDDKSNHFTLLQSLVVLTLQVEKVYEVIPNDDKEGSYQMIQTFDKYFKDYDKYLKVFSKGLTKCDDLKNAFKQLVEKMSYYLNDRTDLEHNNFIIVKRIKFTSYMQRWMDFIIQFVESNHMISELNILDQAKDIVKSNINSIDELADQINMLIIANEDDSFIDELFPDDDEFNSKLLTALMNKFHKNSENLASITTVDIDSLADDNNNVSILDLGAAMFKRIRDSYAVSKSKLDCSNIKEFVDIKPSFKKGSSTGEFLLNLLDLIAISMQEMYMNLGSLEYNEQIEKSMALTMLKFALIHDCIAWHLIEAKEK